MKSLSMVYVLTYENIAYVIVVWEEHGFNINIAYVLRIWNIEDVVLFLEALYMLCTIFENLDFSYTL